jgi:hypothetical protein
MHIRSNITGRLLAGVVIVELGLLAACAPGSPPPTACHYTGSEAAPYEEVAITTANAAEHLGHPNDFMPVPVDGCPVEPVVITDGKIAICHGTSSETNPYNEITVSVNGLNGHGTHEDDLIPVPAEGCPNAPLTATEGKITICHATGSTKNPYSLITISVDGLSGHNGHAGDIIPAPAAGCPSS